MSRYLGAETAMKSRKHILIVEVECFDAQGSREAENRLLRWIETYGHTSTGHGFEFSKMSLVQDCTKEKSE